jgi:dTDP-4-dehydrorhamnose reductase
MKNDRVLVVGGDGIVGSALAVCLKNQGFRVTKTSRKYRDDSSKIKYLDLTDVRTLKQIENNRYDTTVLCAGVSSVRICEETPDITRKINVDGILNLCEKLIETNSRIVYLSSNMVFDGKIIYPSVTDKQEPLTEYGKQKAYVENALRSLSDNTSILRFSKILEPNHPLFSGWIRRLNDGKKIYPFSNKFFSPVSLEFALTVITEVVRSGTNGLVHVSATHDITYLQAARHLAEVKKLSQELIVAKKSNSEYDIRTVRSALDTSSLYCLGLLAPEPLSAINFCVLSG